MILWTRAVPDKNARIDIPQCVTYKVYDKQDGSGKIVSQGWALTGPDVDYTIKVSLLFWSTLHPTFVLSSRNAFMLGASVTFKG